MNQPTRTNTTRSAPRAFLAFALALFALPPAAFGQSTDGGASAPPAKSAPEEPKATDAPKVLDAKSELEARARAWEAAADRAQKSADDASFLKALAQLARDVWRDLTWDIDMLHAGARRFLPDATPARIDALLSRHLTITGNWSVEALRADPRRKFILRDRAVVLAARAVLRGDVELARQAQQHFEWGDAPEASEEERNRMKLLHELVLISVRTAGPAATRWMKTLPTREGTFR